MKTILTPQDKKTLRFVSRYLNSLGMKDGSLESEGFDAYDSTVLTDIKVEEWTHFSNNYSTEVPEQLYPILRKILDFSQNKYNNLDVDTGDNEINYARFDVDIDTENKEISLSYWYTYYDTGDTVGTTYSEEDDDSVTSILDEVKEFSDDLDIMELRYNGSGDSGYIESSFENGELVPASVEDYCYTVLEHMHGGWEINEGSQGTFYFDLKQREITLEHQTNYEETRAYTLYEESFAK
jgi:hypothetical protein